jgi:hypothetical protein
MIGRGIATPHMGGVFDWRSFLLFFRLLLGQAHSRSQALESHILYFNRRSFGQGCVFWDSHRYISSHKEAVPPKTLSLGIPMAISSLNVYGRISAQEKRLTMLDSSKCASRQDTHCVHKQKLRDGVIAGVKLTKVCFKAKCTAKFQSTAENVE